MTEPRDLSDPPSARPCPPDRPAGRDGEKDATLDAVAAQAMAEQADLRASSPEFDRLVQQANVDLARKARNTAWGVLRDSALAEDAVHDAWLKAMKTESYDPGRGSFQKWFLETVRNSAIDLARKESRTGVLGLDDTVERSVVAPLPPAPTPDVLDVVGDADALERVAGALIDGASRLKAVQRDILAHYLFDIHRSHADTAQQWGMSPANVRQTKSRLYQALELTEAERDAVRLYLKHGCSWSAVRRADQDERTDTHKTHYASAVTKLNAALHLSLEEEV